MSACRYELTDFEWSILLPSQSGVSAARAQRMIQPGRIMR
jgi:hypothetical protein